MSGKIALTRKQARKLRKLVKAFERAQDQGATLAEACKSIVTKSDNGFLFILAAARTYSVPMKVAKQAFLEAKYGDRLDEYEEGLVRDLKEAFRQWEAEESGPK